MRVKGGNELILKPSAAKGNHGGRPKVIDDMATFARALKAKGVPVPEITKKLAIKTGKNAGQHPSVASVYRALAEAEEADAQTEAQIIGPRRAEAMGRRDYEDDPNAPAANSLVPAASALILASA